MKPHARRWWLYGGYFVCYAAYQLLMLPAAVLPWFDEVVFASIAHSFITKGELTAEVARVALDGLPFKIYGFLAFILPGIGMQYLPPIWGYRICIWLFGIGVLWACMRVLRLPGWLVVLISMDPFFQLSLHSGRMDMQALYLALLAWGAYHRSMKQIKWQWWVSVVMLLAILTTPRVFVLLLPCLWLALYYRQWRVFVPLVVGYVFWIALAFGSFKAYWLHYMHDFALLRNYVGASGYVPRHQYLLLACCTWAVAYVLMKEKSLPKHRFWGWALWSILLFHVLVYDYGLYSVFLLPLYYLLIFYGVEQLPSQWKRLCWIVLLLWNGGYTLAKQIQLWASAPLRDYRPFHTFISMHIPAGSRVVSEAMSYYALLEAGADLQLIDYYSTLDERERKHRELYNYEYLIVTDHLVWRKPDIIAYYMQKAKLDTLARYQVPPAHSVSLLMSRLGLSDTERTGYSCTIYRRRF